MNLTWRKKCFDSTAYLKYDDQQVGYFRHHTWSNKVEASLNKRDYLFVKRGVFSKYVDIIKLPENVAVGHIKFKSFSQKAEMECEGDLALLQKVSFWSSNKWELRTNHGQEIHYHGGINRGVLKSDTNNLGLILAGLFALKHFIKAAAAAAAGV